MDIKKYLLNNKKLYVVINPCSFSCEDDFLDYIANILKLGADVIHLDFSLTDDLSAVKTGKKIRDLTLSFQALLIIERRADISKIIGADGVFLNNCDLNISNAKEILGTEAFFGGFLNKNNKDAGFDYFLLDSKDIINFCGNKVFREYKNKCLSAKKIYISDDFKDNISDIIRNL